VRTADRITLQEALSLTLPELTSMLASSAAIQVAIISREGALRFANRALAELLKLEVGDLAGRSFGEFLTGPDAEMLRKLLSGKGPLPAEAFLLNFVAGDQIPHTLRCRVAPAGRDFLLVAESAHRENQSLQEELIQLNNQLTVLSRENVRKGRELARTLAQLEKAQAMLVHQEKMASLGVLTAGIAHEINNPLAFVLNNEQVLRRDLEDLLAFIDTLRDALPEFASLAPRIHAGIIAKAQQIGLDYLTGSVPRKLSANIEGLERIGKIILDMRNFSRLDEAQRKLVSVAEGIESTLRFLGPLMKEHGVTVESECAALPPLLCSPGPLNQAISNVLVNAIQASRPGQCVRVVCREEGGWCCIEVTDQGAGIPPEQLSRVFDPFFTTKPVGSGVGLGLSIVSQVVEAHQGRIEINSSPGVGTTVRIMLPQ
jgi:signal transduction histidine kinase